MSELKDFSARFPRASRRLTSLFGADATESHEVHAGTSIQTSIASLDLAIGRLPWGLLDISGPESSGKTGLGFELLAAAQREGCPVLIWATETIDVPYMERVGVDTRNLPVLLGNEREDDFLNFLSAHKNAVVLLDSFSALRPQDEQEASDWNHMALVFLQRAREALAEGSCFVTISQVRARPNTHGATRSASRRVEDLFDVRFEISRHEVQEEDYLMRINVCANAISVPARYVEVPFRKGHGIDKARDLLLCANRLGLADAEGGGWISILWDVEGGPWRLGHGLKKSIEFLRANKKAYDLLRESVYARMPRGI